MNGPSSPLDLGLVRIAWVNGWPYQRMIRAFDGASLAICTDSLPARAPILNKVIVALPSQHDKFVLQLLRERMFPVQKLNTVVLSIELLPQAHVIGP